jgi:hypothetical protein
MRRSALWLALPVALSPSLVELVGHWMREPWSRASAIFVPLGLLAAAADASPVRPRRWGWLLVALGLALALFGSVGGAEALGRLAIPLAVIGMACAVGRPAPPVAAISLFVVPPPFAIASLASPAAERAVAGLAVVVGGALGASWSLGDATIRAAGGDLRLGAEDLGVPLAHLLAGLGYCAGVAGGGDPLRSALRALRWALWALPGQILALGVAFVLLGSVGARTARGFLEAFPVVVAAVGALGSVRLARSAYRLRSASP